MSNTLESVEQTEKLATDDPRFKHIVSFQDKIKGYVNREPIEAICGKFWVPKADPSGLELCPSCKFVAFMTNVEIVE